MKALVKFILSFLFLDCKVWYFCHHVKCGMKSRLKFEQKEIVLLNPVVTHYIYICSQFNLTPAGTFLSVISIISLVLYFVTSSDSGSLVIDCLSANGHPDPPVIQRIFWAVTEGACATGLLVAGGSKALTALQV